MRIRIGLLGGTVAILLLSLSGCTARDTAPEHIDSFDVHYSIASSGVVHAVETIRYDFGSTPDRHGILRFLDSHFVSSATQDRVYSYTNFLVSSPTGAPALFSTATQEDVLLQVGNRNATVGGKQTYVLRYDIHGAIDATTTASGTRLEEFYWNTTGSEWQIPIDAVTITVSGPAASTRVGCAAGAPGSTGSCLSQAKTVTGARFSQGTLTPGNAITVDVGWPAGTFDSTAPDLEPHLSPDSANRYAGTNDGPDPYWTPWNWGVGLGFLLLLPLGYLWFVRIRRRDQEFAGETPGTIPADPGSAPLRLAPLSETVVVQYHPPEGFPVGAAGLLLTKRQTKLDVTVTLLDLAARGHLRIEEVAGGNRGKASDYRLVATPGTATVGDTAAMLPHEKLLLLDLFAGGSKSVTLSKLKYSFASQHTAVETAINAWVQSGGYFLDKLALAHPLLGWTIALSIVTFGGMLFFEKAWTLWPLGALFGAILSVRQSRRAIRRSAVGHAVFLQLHGFKQYIATAEADQVRFEEGIDVFSRYLPWATAFGEADHWTRVFADLSRQGRYEGSIDWYVGNQHLLTTAALTGSLAAISSLGASINDLSAFATESLSASPPTTGSSGGSGFGGGDFGGSAGGGGGGGGGGSW